MRAWLFQDSKQKQRLGDKAPWSVGWFNPDGRKRSKAIGTKSNAEKFQRRKEGELAAGLVSNHANKTWQDFRGEYEREILSLSSVGDRVEKRRAFKNFERVIKPGKLSAIDTRTIDQYKSRRATERGQKKDSLVSPATINKELRCLKAALRKARRWKYLTEVPDFDMLREPTDEPTYITLDHFQAIFNACDVADCPKGLPYPAGDWWRGLLAFAYMTGWRISEVLSMKWEDLDSEAGTVRLWAKNTKGRKGSVIPLHPQVWEQLPGKSFSALVFPWLNSEKHLRTVFRRIQESAGINLACSEEHEHTPFCHVYAFHDCRRAFATNQAAAMTANELQRLMRHQSYLTTKRYISMADRLDGAVAKMSVPLVLQSNTP